MGVDGLGRAMGQAMVALAVLTFLAGALAAAAVYGLVELVIYLIHHLHWVAS